MSDPALQFVNALAQLVGLTILLYWAIDCALTGRYPWHCTYLDRSIRLNQRDRDWNGD